MQSKLAIHDFLTTDEQKLLIDLNPDTLMLVNPADGLIVYSNQPRPHLPMQRLLGSSYFDLGRPGGRVQFEQAMQKASQQLLIVEQEVELDEGGGRFGWSMMRLIPVVRDGRPQYVLVILADITPLKHAIAELQSSRQRLQDHLEQTPLAAMMWDAKQITVEWNPAAEKVFGYSRAEAIGRPFTELMVPKQEWHSRREQFSRAIATGVIDKYPPYANTTKDGREIICEWFSSTIKNAAGEVVGIASLAQDVTAKLQAEKALEAAKLAAEQSAQAKAGFLANMSHEIRTPMNGILGMIELMRREPLSESQQSKLTIIHQSTQTLLTILNDILDFSKIESNAMAIESIPLDLNHLLRRSVELMRPASEKKGLTLRWQPIAEPCHHILGDPSRLNQVLSNLISNAIKFTEQGFVAITARCQPEGEQLRVSIVVEDSGIGIRAEDIGSIFEGFSQADASISRRYGGTGLGLTICQRLALLMNGHIRVESEYQKGSRFVFEFLTWPAGVMLPSASETAVTSEQRFQGRVLLVDDNDVNLQVGARMLETLGLEVLTAGSGQQALQHVAAEPPLAMVLMDIHMPDMTGLEASRQIRQQHPLYQQIPIVAVTANVLDEERQHCLEAGMDDFLAKPFSLLQLSGLLQRWLADKPD